MTPIGTRTVSGTTLLQGHAGGASSDAEASLRVEFPVTDSTILAGQGVALTTALTNHCRSPRRAFFAYDGLYATLAPSHVRFQCCFTRTAKCGSSKIKATAKTAACLLGLAARQAGKGNASDPDKIEACRDKLSKIFDRLDKKGGCPTLGDAGPISAKVDTFVADMAADLDPLGPPNRNSCQAGKIKATTKLMSCILTLDSQRAAKGQFLDPDLSKLEQCRAKLLSAFTVLDRKGPCITSGDASAITAAVDAFTTDVATTLACPCP